ncbi:MAG: hypothetical protein RML56_05995 [Burkholderiales bacterium]|nr:hypothetical protein [Burkholderiales bacterium]
MVIGSALWLAAHLPGKTVAVLFWDSAVPGIRFHGWSVNANQMALLLVAAPFLGLILLRNLGETASIGFRFGVVLAVATSVAAGWATASGALRVAWSVSVPIMVGLLFFAAVQGDRQSRRDLASLLQVAVCAVPIWLLSRAVLRAPACVTLTSGFSLGSDIVQVGDIPVRLQLIRHGLEAWFQSPWFGLGPGAHSGVTAPNLAREAHSSLIDWLTNTGLVGGSALIALCGWIAWRLLRQRDWVMLSALAAFAAFAQAHHVLRHPLVWFFLVLAARWPESHSSRHRRR